MGAPAIFLDRDGVVNENLPDHVTTWSKFRFLPGAIGAIEELTTLGVPILVVTNQGIVGRRLATRACVEDIHRRMVRHVRSAGGRIDAVMYCPHRPEDGCHCRKPQPGLLLDASRRFDIDLERSVLVGDALTDIAAGKRIGCKTILVLTGRGRQARQELALRPALQPDATADDLAAAVPLVAEFVRRAPVTAGAVGAARLAHDTPTWNARLHGDG